MALSLEQFIDLVLAEEGKPLDVGEVVGIVSESYKSATGEEVERLLDVLVT